MASTSFSPGYLLTLFGPATLVRGSTSLSLPFIFGACANVGSGVTCDFLLKRFGLKVARCRVGIIGLACGGLFALLASVTSSKYGTLLLLCLSFAGISFDEPMNFLTCIDVARKFPVQWLVRTTQPPMGVPFFLASCSAMSQRSSQL